MDFDQTASRLYGGDQPDATPEATAAPTSPRPEQEIADRLFGAEAGPAQRDLPPAVKALRDARMYDEGLGDTTLEQGALDVAGYAGIDLAETARVAADLGATRDDLQQLAMLAGQHREVDDSTFASWEAESRGLIGTEFSARDLELAKQLVARDPAVFEYLDASGLGSHPAVVRRFVRLARDARARGEL